MTGSSFMRVMEFVGAEEELDISGLFNTIRAGDKWADLEVGEEVSVTVRTEDEAPEEAAVLCVARVAAVVTGDMHVLVCQHAHMNHGVRRLPEGRDRIGELYAILRRCYPDMEQDGPERRSGVAVYLQAPVIE